MDAAELRETWAENKDRPAFVRNYRAEIHERTDLDEPIPDGSLAQVRHWLGRYKGTVTRQLREAAEESEDGETTNTADGEGEGNDGR